jgi:hypothetical protein
MPVMDGDWGSLVLRAIIVPVIVVFIAGAAAGFAIAEIFCS